VAAAGRQPFAVMIARGDLAVEIGYERLAEMQEEILWICEAAHVPVIWATQVLERLVKKGTPSRAEMTDAAMGERAECVMLNKGPYLAEAVAIRGGAPRRATLAIAGALETARRRGSGSVVQCGSGPSLRDRSTALHLPIVTHRCRRDAPDRHHDPVLNHRRRGVSSPRRHQKNHRLGVRANARRGKPS
jgi:hypothetical protein